MEVNETELAHEDLRILRYIVSQEGADAPEIRDAFGIDSSSTTSHRLDKLEQAGLVESEYMNSSHPGRLSPRLAHPTRKAERVVEDLPDRPGDIPETLTVEERLERMERRFDTARMEIFSLQQHIRELGERLDNHGLVFENQD